MARSLTDTFSGIRPTDLPGFVLAELAGSVAALLVFTWLLQPTPARAAEPRELPETAKRK